jgi:hypothetical protein
VRALLPGGRATRAAALAAFSLGLLWAGSVTLLAVARALPLGAAAASAERRLRRWLANRRAPVTAAWRPLVRALLASRAGPEVTLALDPTPYRDAATVYVLGLVARGRALPIAWHVLPGRARWRRPEVAYLRRLFRVVAGWLPPGCTVTLVADRGLAGADLIGLCRGVGWHWVLRLSADAAQGPTVRTADGRERPVWALVSGPGQRWGGPVALFKRAGGVECALTIQWRRGYDAPWLLISDRPAGGARARADRRRRHAEATYQDGKRRGWGAEQSKVADPDRLHRPLLALFVALWWAAQLGMRAVRAGLRRRFDRADRRDRGLARLGRRLLGYLLAHGRRPPLPFHYRQAAGRFAWLL